MLDLGKTLVKELNLDPGVDTLSRWMAHYVAELIHDAESAKIEDRPAKLTKCSDAILGLWDRRRLLPDGRRPFEDLEPILRTLKSLDPTDDTPRYFRYVRTNVDETKEDTETNKWLKTSDCLDYSAKLLIRFCLAQAAQAAIEKSRNWVTLAETAGAEKGIDLQVIRFITDENNLMTSKEPNDSEQKMVKDRIEQLCNFKKIAEVLMADLQRQLDQLQQTVKKKS